MLGCLYGNGLGVGKDYSKAMQWSVKAAQQGHSGAQCNVGITAALFNRSRKKGKKTSKRNGKEEKRIKEQFFFSLFIL